MQSDTIKAGDQVRILKGTEIKTCGKIRNKIAGQTHIVTVHHMLSGRQITACSALGNDLYKNQLEKLNISEADLILLCDSDPHAFYTRCDITITPPTVCWSGSGGYWHEVSALLVEKLVKEDV